MAFRYTRIEEGKRKSSYDDHRMRSIAIDFYEKTLGLKFKGCSGSF